jgi:uncharacterized membrane protein YgcG
MNIMKPVTTTTITNKFMDIFPDIFNFVGSNFLAFYGGAVAVTGGVLYAVRKAVLKMPDEKPEPVTGAQDAYFLGFLGGGAAGLLKTGLVRMSLSKKIVKCTDEKKGLFELSDKKDDLPFPTVLSEASKKLEYLIEDKKTLTQADLKKGSDFMQGVKKICEEHLAEALRRGLIYDESARNKMFFTRFIGVAGLFFLGLIKIIIGISLDKPVGFLIALTILGVLMSFFMTLMPRLTDKGKKYLGDLKIVYADTAKKLKGSQIIEKSEEDKNLPTVYGVDAWTAAGAVSLFGTTALVGTEFSFLNDTFEQVRFSGDGSSASCGGASCSSGDGGSSCGGGCGGGGCGGCGGI